MGASSRSPSPMTISPSMSSSFKTRRMASTPAWSTRSESPLPATRLAAMAACSVMRTVSSTNARSRYRPGPFRAGLPVLPASFVAVAPSPLAPDALAFDLAFFFGFAMPHHGHTEGRSSSLYADARDATGSAASLPVGREGLRQAAAVPEIAGGGRQHEGRHRVRPEVRDAEGADHRGHPGDRLVVVPAQVA